MGRLASLLLLVAPLLAGCSPWGMAIGAGATVASTALEERGLGGAVDDNRIMLDIDSKFLGTDAGMLTKVDVEVHEGRVLLAGRVSNRAQRVEAVRLAWQVDGVTQIINEIQVAEPEDVGDYMHDIWLAQELHAVLLVDSKVRAVNYNVDCVGGTIYLMGVAQNKAELQRAIDHARDIPYVRQVVSYVRIKDAAKPVKPQPATPAPNSGSLTAAQPAAAPP
ncbi:MAG TPA: BON domain-containing protein [Verrucomicrobiae bacterium]|nr:BON domain-containing protein [Verrucomicrobiae bacterium]